MEEVKKQLWRVADRARTGHHGRLMAVHEAVELRFTLSLCPLLLIVNQTIPSTYNTRDAKEKQQDCRQPIQPT